MMALTLADFHRSLKALAPDLVLQDGQTEVALPEDGKPVRITFEPQEGATLGGLLALPRARVTLAFDNTDREERARFLARFDRAFQRGGG